MTTIYMVRHAESPLILGEERIRGLSPRGHEDVKRVEEIMRFVEVDVVVSSPYARALLTVKGVAEAKGLPVIELEELRERPIVGLQDKLAQQAFTARIRQSFDDKDFVPDGGESTRQAQERAIPIIGELLRKYEGKSIVIGTHGNIMTIILNHYDDRYGVAFWESTSIPDIYRLDFAGEKLVGVRRMWEENGRKE
ncbi:hypothetical protein PAECIP111893_04303 [Paenibacillus plantiphilus]|uniref:Histidine phosphatase family protein n=1 Tax=Paenibacillus plantiphilus TaxID=2905650 RepID=A0ABM9CP62_9BACL|nr:histidine phosphatase family protein [Paenibacillus plantiphilus]CAH1217761.1 hypothetical protein PAECIP111893_04303 [Paenibacillus plantiphilus]